MNGICDKITEIDYRLCPNCGKPFAVLRGFDKECAPVSFTTHQVNPQELARVAG